MKIQVSHPLGIFGAHSAGMQQHTVPLIYRPRRPWTTALYQVVDRHFETFAASDDPFASVYGPWRPVVRTTAEAYLDCGRYEGGYLSTY